MICSSLYLLVLISIILQVDGLLGNMTGTVYGGQVTLESLTKIPYGDANNANYYGSQMASNIKVIGELRGYAITGDKGSY